MTTIDLDELPDELRTKAWHKWAKNIELYYVASTPFTQYFDTKDLRSKVSARVFIDTLYENKVLVVEDEIDFLLIAELYRELAGMSLNRMLHTDDEGNMVDNYNVEKFHLAFYKSRMIEFLADKSGVGKYSTFTEFAAQFDNPTGTIQDKYKTNKITDTEKFISIGRIAQGCLSDDDTYGILEMPAFVEAYEQALHKADTKSLNDVVDSLVDQQNKPAALNPKTFL